MQQPGSPYLIELKVISLVADAILCQAPDGRPDETCRVFRPSLLMMTPFNDRDVNGLHYKYIDEQTRAVNFMHLRDDPPEHQKIVPPYREGDYIYAAYAMIDGEFKLVDINADARHWAQIKNEDSK